MKRLFVTIVVFAASMSLLSVSAQKGLGEVSVYAGGGLSTLSYKAPPVDRSGGGGGDFGVGYTYFINNEHATQTGTVSHGTWGVYAGVGLSLFNAKAGMAQREVITRRLRDNESHTFDMHSKISDFNESQNVMLLTVPVMALFQLNQIYAMGGVKIGFPVGTKYQADYTIINEGYYPDFENWARTQKFAGFGTFPGVNSSGKIDSGVCTFLSLESGMKFQIAEKLLLYAGAYFDYGLNNTVKSAPDAFLIFNPGNPEDISTNSILTTVNEKVNMFAVGIKVRLAFSL